MRHGLNGSREHFVVRVSILHGTELAIGARAACSLPRANGVLTEKFFQFLEAGSLIFPFVDAQHIAGHALDLVFPFGSWAAWHALLRKANDVVQHIDPRRAFGGSIDQNTGALGILLRLAFGSRRNTGRQAWANRAIATRGCIAAKAASIDRSSAA